VLFVALFAVAGFQTLIVSSQKRIDELDRSIVAATEEAQQLENRLALLQSPQRITAEATERLGMLSPPGVGYLIPAPDDDARAAVVPEPSSIAPEVAADAGEDAGDGEDPAGGAEANGVESDPGDVAATAEEDRDAAGTDR
jgi:hypothetical protein